MTTTDRKDEGRTPDWQALNAYVDGALSPEEARKLERAAACDPEVARALDELHRTKDATAALLSEDAAIPPALPAAPAPERRSGLLITHTAMGMAAAAAAILLIVAGLAFWPSTPGPDRLAAWVGQAETHYRQQLDAPLASAAELAALPASLQPQAPAFDLTLAGLNLVDTSVSEQGIYLAYQGHRGCRLGLWIAAAPERLAPELQESLRDGLLLATWRSGDAGFALLSQDMDPRRFTTIARLLRSRTDAQQQIAADSESLTLPCLG